jgi:hypothetical protein
MSRLELRLASLEVYLLQDQNREGLISVDEIGASAARIVNECRESGFRFPQTMNVVALHQRSPRWLQSIYASCAAEDFFL